MTIPATALTQIGLRPCKSEMGAESSADQAKANASSQRRPTEGWQTTSRIDRRPGNQNAKPREPSAVPPAEDGWHQ
jgi:hypothetical protein